jgi:hypothetical protein
MFALGHLFTAMKRLTSALNKSAELFESANEQLEARLVVDPEIDRDLPELPGPAPQNTGNDHTRRIARTRT